MKKGQIELLAPAGEPEIAKAALRAGADACYIGGKWSARAFAKFWRSGNKGYIGVCAWAQ